MLPAAMNGLHAVLSFLAFAGERLIEREEKKLSPENIPI
jgi:hypothetical protein